MLIAASLYWFTRTGPAAADFSWELAHADNPGWGDASAVPQGASLFYSNPLVRKVLGPGDNTLFFREHTEGGHSPAFEVPDLFLDDVRSYSRTLRTR